MRDEQIFESKVLDGIHSTALISLGKQILGGSEALEFSNIIASYHSNSIKHIIIDLSKIEVINSSGLGMLVSGLSQTKKFDLSLSLVAVPDKVMSLLKMTHLNEVFKIYSSIDDATSEIKI